MRILNEESDKPIKSVSIFLTPEEAKELRDALSQLLDRPDNNHIHVSDPTFEREITVAVYTADNLEYFTERVRRLVEKET